MNDSSDTATPAPGSASIGSRLKKAAGGKFVRDTIILQAGMAVTMATYVVTSVLLARGMGATDFGRYNTAFALYGIVYFSRTSASRPPRSRATPKRSAAATKTARSGRSPHT
jgi:hypothetical protein